VCVNLGLDADLVAGVRGDLLLAVPAGAGDIELGEQGEIVVREGSSFR
jgi:hypothetical protein